MDRAGERRRITIYRTAAGFDFVSETLYCHSIAAAGKPSAEHLRGQVTTVFGLNEVKFEFPHLGIFASELAPQTKSSGLSTRRYSSP
jgi:hypothetical protein